MREIIVADDQELYRAGVVSLLANHGYHSIFQFSDSMRLLAGITTNRGSLVIAATSLILDLEHIARRSREAGSRLLLVAEDYDSPLRYSSLGAVGLIHRSTSASAFLESVRKIKNGVEFLLPADWTERLANLNAGLATAFSPIEIKIILFLMRGMKNRVIAECLQVEEHIVRAGLQKIYDKTGFSNRLELAMHFARQPLRWTTGSASAATNRRHFRSIS
jgi:DNA-binding NarL/FixJ family response regulator